MQAVAVAAAAVGTDQETARTRVTCLTHVFPPLSDTLHGKLRRIRPHPDIDPAAVVPDIVNPVRYGLGHLWIGEIMRQNLDGIALRTPLLTRILIGSNQFLLLRVHRDDRYAPAQKYARLIVDVAKLCIALRVIHDALRALAIALQGIVQLMQQIGNAVIADLPSVLLQRRFQLPRAQGRPTQRRLRIPTHARLDQGFKFLYQIRLMLAQPLAATARATDPLRDCASLQIRQSSVNRLPAHPGEPRHGLNPTSSVALSLSRHNHPSLLLIHQRQYRRQLSTQRLVSNIHHHRILDIRHNVSVILSQSLSQLDTLLHHAFANSMQRQHRLLLLALERDPRQIRLPCRTGNGLRIVAIVLLPATEGLHVVTCDQMRLVSQRPDLTRPMMSASTRLHHHSAARNLRYYRQQLRSTYPPLQHRHTMCVHSMQ